jgi:4-amino-4-deoxy-L-arabinose transferase-like glycosyltransferase
MVTPTMTRVPLWDDWVYARSVQNFVHGHTFAVHELSVASGAFHILWGALFATIFGFNFGVLRLSVVVLVLFGGIALYGSCCELKVPRREAALCAALFLFYPLVYVVSMSFMTDMTYVALLCIATYFYLRGRDAAVGDGRFLVAGSVAASAALLVRQQGILIPLALLAWLIVTRRLRVNAHSVRTAIQVTLLPGLAFIWYVAWRRVGAEGPHFQTQFVEHALKANYTSVGWRAALVSISHAGTAAVPLILGSIPGLVAIVRRVNVRRLLGFGILSLVMSVAASRFFSAGNRMPFAASWWTTRGLGPDDFVASRTPLLSQHVSTVLTIVAFTAGGLLMMVFLDAIARRAREGSHPGGPIVAILCGQFLGVLIALGAKPESLLDRYFLPVIPLILCLAFYALSRAPKWTAALVAGALLFAVYSVAETRNFLVLQDTSWKMANDARRAGVPISEIEAGAGWDGWHLYDEARRQGLHYTGSKIRGWWFAEWDLPIKGTYVVAPGLRTDYTIVRRVEYPQWFRSEPHYVYLLREQP